MSKTYLNRILAVDLRARRLGFAVLESPHRLLDVGISQFDSAASAGNRMRALIRMFRPAVLVVDGGTTRGPRNQRRTASIRKMIRKQVRLARVPVSVISAGMLRTFFMEHGVRNKYSFAALAATWFPQLSWKRVPTERECYDPEPWVMVAFDAVALGAAYLAQHHQDSGQVLSPAPR